MTPTPGKPRWIGWRRPLGPSGRALAPWQILPDTEAATKGACYDLMAQYELRFDEHPHEYVMLPVGERPPHDLDVPQAYRTREMRPQR